VEDAREALLAVVSQLTGYPRETLDLTMDMEADLGIDSIKRVEILSLLSKRIPNAPAVNPEKLAGLRTLEQVLGFATNGATNGATRAATPNATAEERPAPAKPADSAPLVSAPVRRGVVVAVAAPEVTGSSELPRGPILVTRDHSGLALALVRRLTEVGADARVIDAAEVPAGPVGALVLLAPDRPTWDAGSEGDLMDALRAARSVGPRLRESGASSNALLVAVSRRDGAFGHTTQAAVWNPLQAGLAGLAKSAAHEWPEVSCRAIDVASSLSLDDAAKAIVRELETHGPREVGVGPAGRVALALRAPHRRAREASVLGDGAIVVTGGARGVTFACARALALRTGAKLVLLGRSPEPAPEPAWLASASTEAEIKRACLDNAPAGERPAPKALGEACRAVLANREVEGSLRALAAEGIVAVYRSVDVRDGARVAAILSELRPAVGPIRALVHGAGVIRDKRLEDKQDKDLEDVLAPKILGLRSLLEATRGDDLRSIVLFASATGRFGRRGQADYAVANQALVSIAQVEAAKRPRCRVVALDWGPWEGGMVTPALRAEFEREGVPLLSLAQGSQAMCDDALAEPGGPTEIVLGAGFGSDEVAAWTLASSYRLDASSFPVLRDHVLAGKAVLPLALSIEWLIAGASHVEGTDVTSLEDIRVFRGVTLGAEPEDVFLWVGPREPSASGHRVVVELRGASGHVHVRAHASFEALSLPAPSLAPPPSLRPFRTPMPHVYAEQLFHGESLHAIESIEGMSEAGMVLRLRSHPTSERLLPPPVVAWRLDPLLLDGVFQALIVWCRENVGAPSLPSRLGALRFLAAPLASSLRATVRIRSREGMVVRADIDLHDEHGALCVRVEGFECTASPSLQRAFAAAASPEKPSTVPVA
jgi:NAD(P)-dependent dehydrogenase (short-subunit alcohol dehydrogenase family)